MADNAGRVATMARILSIMHIIVGSLLICFGIADRAVEYFYTGDIGFGIWIGIWVSCDCLYFNFANAISNSKILLIFKLKKRWIINLTWVYL